jgi:hypothetical protein
MYILLIDEYITMSLLQLCWSLVTSEEQWAHMSNARYLKHGKPINYNIASSIWSGLKSHLSLVYIRALLLDHRER